MFGPNKRLYYADERRTGGPAEYLLGGNAGTVTQYFDESQLLSKMKLALEEISERD